jgi:hypothetical protein
MTTTQLVIFGVSNYAIGVIVGLALSHFHDWIVKARRG